MGSVLRCSSLMGASLKVDEYWMSTFYRAMINSDFKFPVRFDMKQCGAEEVNTDCRHIQLPASNDERFHT